MTDLLRAVAQAGVDLSNKIDRPVSLVSLYDKDNINSLALSAGYLRLCLEKSIGEEINIIDDRLSKIKKDLFFFGDLILMDDDKDMVRVDKDSFKTLNLKENTLYKVKVKVSEHNVEHESVLFTGFNNGAYCVVYNNTYDYPVPFDKIYSIKILQELTPIK